MGSERLVQLENSRAVSRRLHAGVTSYVEFGCAEEVGDLQGEMGVVLAEEATMEAEVAVHDSGARRLLPGRSAWTVSPVCEPQLLR